MAKRQHTAPFVYLARADRNELVGEVRLTLIRDQDMVELSDQAEYFTVGFLVDPFLPTGSPVA